ncbi:MAG: LamG-like jellyroll fold domain-containing protein, partial [Verrucomicrobiota bacterium]
MGLHHGTQNGNDDAPGLYNGGQEFDGNEDYIQFPALNSGSVTTRQWSMFALIRGKRTGWWSGIMMARPGPHTVGLQFGDNGYDLRYIWRAQGLSFGFDSGLQIPTNDWALVGVTVNPTQAILYLSTSNQFSAATNDLNHVELNLTNSWRIGQDMCCPNRYFDGIVDEARVIHAERSENWVKAMSLNTFSNTVFTSYGPAFDNLGVAHGNGAVAGVGQAALNGRLSSESPADVTIYWGDNDGGTNAGLWDHAITLTNIPGGDFSTVASNIGIGATYYYRLFGSNSFRSVWSSNSESFATPLVTREIKIQFCGYPGGGTLTNVPVLIPLSTNIPGFDYADFRSLTGGDLRFFDPGYSNGLFHQIETWNPGGTSLVWVRVPELVDSNTCIFAWYGHDDTNFPAYTQNDAVWSDHTNVASNT